MFSFVFSLTTITACLVESIESMESSIESYNISVEFSSLNDPKYLGNSFNGAPSSRSSGAITGFKDTSVSPNSRVTDETLYYFVSDYDWFRIGSPITIVSSIYNENNEEFDNDKNVIARELPLQVYIGNESLIEGGQGLLSCTNPITYDIIVCAGLIVDHGFRASIFCTILYNNYVNPQWSKKVKIDLNEVLLQTVSYTLECFHDSYMILFETGTVEDNGPNTLYTLLELNGNIKIAMTPVFNDTKFNYSSSIFPANLILSHQNRVSTISDSNNNNMGYKSTQILLAGGVSFLGEVDAFYLHYTNISDVDDSNGPLYVNYQISGQQFLSRNVKHTLSGWQPVITNLRYFEMNSQSNCCYMMAYCIDSYIDQEERFARFIYLSIIDGNGEKLFKNDTLIAEVTNSLLHLNSSATVVQLNTNGTHVNNNDDLFYFSVIYTDRTNVYARVLSIATSFDTNKNENNTNDDNNDNNDGKYAGSATLTLLDTILLANVYDFPKVDEDQEPTIVDIYVNDELKFNQHIIFLMYQVSMYLVNGEYYNQTSTDFIQSFRYNLTISE